MTVSETIAVSSTKKHFKKPDEAAQTVRLEELNKKLDTLKKQQVKKKKRVISHLVLSSNFFYR